MCVNIFKLTRDMTPININNQKNKSSVCFVLLFVCLYICVCECLPHNNHQTNHKNNTTCGSAYEPGGSGLPCYCAPPVCVPAVLGALAVWQFSTKKNKKKENERVWSEQHRVCFLIHNCVILSLAPSVQTQKTLVSDNSVMCDTTKFICIGFGTLCWFPFRLPVPCSLASHPSGGALLDLCTLMSW